MISWDRIEELQDDIGAEDFGEVAEIFLDELETTIAQMVADPSAGDIAERLHFVRGCALNLGFQGVATHASAGERAIAEGQALDLAGLRSCFAASRTAFQDRLGDAAAA